MNREEQKNALLAVLFAVAEPIAADKLADALGLSPEETLSLLQELSAALDGEESGLQLLRFEDRFQLSTRPRYAEYVVRAMDTRRNAPLSQAAMEVLAIVAYNQPVSRAFVDEVRGVDSASALSTLISKNLVAEAGRLDLPGRPISFVTTDNFLRCFNLHSLEELPPVHEEQEEAASQLEQLLEP